MTIGDRIKCLRMKLGMSQTDLAEKIGTTKQNIYKYENGIITNIPSDKIEALAMALFTSPAYLMGWSDSRRFDYRKYSDEDLGDLERRIHRGSMFKDTEEAGKYMRKVLQEQEEDDINWAINHTISIRFLGTVAAGYNHVAVDEHECLKVPGEWLGHRRPEEFFALRVKGDSMYPKYCNGDEILCLHDESSAESGQVYVVLYGDEEATLKKIECSPNDGYIDLVPINPMFPPKRIEGSDLNQFRILGRVVRLIRTEDKDIDNKEGV